MAAAPGASGAVIRILEQPCHRAIASARLVGNRMGCLTNWNADLPPVGHRRSPALTDPCVDSRGVNVLIASPLTGQFSRSASESSE